MNPIRLTIDKKYAEHEQTVRIFKRVMAGKDNPDLLEHNILALCSYLAQSTDVVTKFKKRCEALESRVAHFNDIIASIDQALCTREDELKRRAI